MSWRTLSAEEREVLHKGLHRNTLPNWIAGLYVAFLRQATIDGLLISYQEQGKGFTICTLLNILRDGSVELRVGVSRKRDEDPSFPLRGRIESFKRSLWAQPQVVQTKRQEAAKSGRPKGMMRIRGLNGSIHDRHPGNVKDISWLPEDHVSPDRTEIRLYGTSSIEYLYDVRSIDEVYSEKSLAESELRS